MQDDKAGKAYWDNAWKHGPLPGAVDPHLPGLNNHINRRIHEYLIQVFSSNNLKGCRLLEIGCGSSSWLPYFAKEFGCKVAGIDYSETGCDMSKRILRNAGVDGEVICADVFNAPQAMVGKFDVVTSFGVAEHYTNTIDCITAFARYLAPGGIIVTFVPNMTALPGLLQKLVDRRIYDIHVPLDREALARAHQQAGLDVCACEYLMFLNLNVINAENRVGTYFYKIFVRLRSWISKAVWITERVLPIFPVNRITSPYVVCVAKNHRSGI